MQEGVQEIVDTLKEYEEVNERFGDPEVLEDPDKMDALDQPAGGVAGQDRRYGRMEPRQPPGTCDGRFALSAGGSGGGYAVGRRAPPGGPLPFAAPAAGRILLLDEPTNHLDAESIDWLEQHLQQYAGTVICITHDRYFLDHVAGWILELDRGEGIPLEG